MHSNRSAMLKVSTFGVCHGRPDPEGALHVAGVRRPGDGPAVAACLASGVPRGGSAAARRLRRVRHRRSVDPGDALRRWERGRVLQRLPAPGHAVGLGRGHVRRGPHPLPVPRLVLRPVGLCDRRARPRRVPGSARPPAAGSAAGGNVGGVRPSPRLSSDDGEVEEGEILASLVAGLGGAFLKDEKAVVDELCAADLPAGTMLGAFQERRMKLLASRGFDVTDFTPDRMTSAEDVYWFPNMVGPIYPGSALLFRMRPNGLDPD